jgi:hypothetical protein
MENESVLNILKLIFAGSPLTEVLAIIAQLVESQGDSVLCTIWLPDEDGRRLYCAAAPSLPGFAAQVGLMSVGPRARHAALLSFGESRSLLPTSLATPSSRADLAL